MKNKLKFKMKLMKYEYNKKGLIISKKKKKKFINFRIFRYSKR